MTITPARDMHPLEHEDRAREPYDPPRAEVLGLVYDLTFGVSPGLGDSNDPANLRALSGPGSQPMPWHTQNR